MKEPWDEEAFAQEELRDLTSRMTTDPAQIQMWRAARKEIFHREECAQERRVLFMQLVFLGAISMTPPDPAIVPVLTWRQCIVNNSYAVPLPEDRADILVLAREFLAWYSGDSPRPAWVPAVLEWTDMVHLPVCLFPLPPAPEERHDAAS
jgi:hypothetical protein